MRDALGRIQSVLVLGGGSEIALATVRRLVANRCRTVLLAVRDPSSIEAEVELLRTAGATTVEAVPFDACAFDTHEGFVREISERYGDLDAVIVAFGVLGDQATLEDRPQEAVRLVETNFTGVVSVCLPVAKLLREQGHGTLVVLSSVAGQRVRADNFVYGSSKAGLDGFAQGLDHALMGSGARVLVVRPGFVKTKMTRDMRPAPFSVTADDVAAAVVRAMAREDAVVWVPGVLRWVMTAMKLLPRPLWRRVSAMQSR